eukprot:m.1067181 g.1067181  ORF g.1067181 m.1067181 type:complete len:307 (+) comp24221_c0_seq6:1376-2296(+)
MLVTTQQPPTAGIESNTGKEHKALHVLCHTLHRSSTRDTHWTALQRHGIIPPVTYGIQGTHVGLLVAVNRRSQVADRHERLGEQCQRAGSLCVGQLLAHAEQLRREHRGREEAQKQEPAHHGECRVSAQCRVLTGVLLQMAEHPPHVRRAVVDRCEDAGENSLQVPRECLGVLGNVVCFLALAQFSWVNLTVLFLLEHGIDHIFDRVMQVGQPDNLHELVGAFCGHGVSPKECCTVAAAGNLQSVDGVQKLDTCVTMHENANKHAGRLLTVGRRELGVCQQFLHHRDDPSSQTHAVVDPIFGQRDK